MNRIIILILVMLGLANSIYGFEMYFEQGDSVEIFTDSNSYILKLVIDNSNAVGDYEYVSDASELSYLQINPAGVNENLVYLVNSRDFKDVGMYIDKDVKETIGVELRLPLTEKWKESYIVEVVGITPDQRQQIAKIEVKLTDANIETLTNKFTTRTLIIGIIGILFIIAILFGISKFAKSRGKKTW